MTDNDKIEANTADEFASLGGDKLNKALKSFDINLSGKKCVDIGASNGGFTDCMLRAGASQVYAVDVADCALPKNLIEDGRVVIRSNINARSISVVDIDGKCDFLSIDVSFISLKLVLPACLALLKDDGSAVALIKPQFELGKKAGKSGIVINPKDRLNIVNGILSFVSLLGYVCVDVTAVPKNFENKNTEYLIYIFKHTDKRAVDKISLQNLYEL